MSTPELQASVTALETRRAELLRRLSPLREGAGKPVDEEEREAAEKDVRVWRARARGRKKACEELWGAIGEGLPEGKTGEELWVGLNEFGSDVADERVSGGAGIAGR